MPSNIPVHDACQVCGEPVYLADPPAEGVPAHWDCWLDETGPDAETTSHLRGQPGRGSGGPDRVVETDLTSTGS